MSMQWAHGNLKGRHRTLVTIKNGHCFNFWLLNVLKYLFLVFLNINLNLPKNGHKKTIAFHILQNTGWYKKRVVATPLFTKNYCISNWAFFETKNIDVEQKHNLKSGNSKEKKKGVETKNKTGNQKKREDWWRNILQFNIMMLFLSWNKSKEERKGKKETKTRNQKKANKKDKKEGKRTRTRERQRKRNWKRGKPKKAKEKQRETLKNKQNMPFSRGKTRFVY